MQHTDLFSICMIRVLHHLVFSHNTCIADLGADLYSGNGKDFVGLLIDNCVLFNGTVLTGGGVTWSCLHQR